MKWTLEGYTLRLKRTFRLFGYSKDVVPVGIVRLREANIEAYGEVSPLSITGETLEQTQRVLRELQNREYPALLFHDQFSEFLRQTFPQLPSTRAALDMACLDWLGKKWGLPLYQLLGVNPEYAPPTSFTIGIDEPEVITEKVQEATPFPVLKVKLGTSYDQRIIETIRQLTDKPLRVDANEAWTKEEAVEKIDWLATQNVELVEQPLPIGHLEDVAWLRERISLPLFADEDVMDSSDVLRLQGIYDGINIKLMKCGGIHEALRMVHIARALDMKVMIGCMIESSVGITAAAHLAPLADYVDLDGNLLIDNDPFVGVSIEEGRLVLSGDPGLGVRPRTAHAE